MADQPDSTVFKITIKKLTEVCGNSNPNECGIVECEGKIFQGYLSEGEPLVPGQQTKTGNLLLSLHEIRGQIAKEGFSDLPPDSVYLVYWVESENPIVLEWHIFIEDDILGIESFTHRMILLVKEKIKQIIRFFRRN